MGIYVERSVRHSIPEGTKTDVWTVYRQPTWRHWLGEVLWEFSMRSIRLERAVEPPLEWLHRRRGCNDDCATGVVGRRMPDGSWSEKVEPYCERLPIGPAIDCWLNEFSRRDREELAEATKPRPATDGDAT